MLVAYFRLCRHFCNLAEGGCLFLRFHFTRCRYFLGHVTCWNLPWQGLTYATYRKYSPGSMQDVVPSTGNQALVFQTLVIKCYPPDETHRFTSYIMYAHVLASEHGVRWSKKEKSSCLFSSIN